MSHRAGERTESRAERGTWKANSLQVARTCGSAPRPARSGQRLYRMSARTMWQVMSDGGWIPTSSAIRRIVLFFAWFGR